MKTETKYHPNLHWQLPILIGILVAATVAALTWFLVDLERQNLTREFQLSILHQGRAVAGTLSFAAHEMNPENAISRALVSAKEDNPYLFGVYFFSAGGVVYSADEEIVPLSVEGEPVDVESLRAGEEFLQDGGFFYLSLPVFRQFTTPAEFTALGELRLVLSKEPIVRALERSTSRGVLTGVAALVIATGLSILIFKRVLHPLKLLRRGVKQLGAGNLSYRIELKTKNEFGLLASAFNEMAERLANSHTLPDDEGRLARDLEIARQLQHSYLPAETPSYRDVDIAGFCEPAYEVGGDFYDFIPIDDRRLGVVVADVSGKSMQGLMVMLMLRTILRSTAPRHYEALPTLCETNTILSPDMRPGTFVTCVYYVYDSRNHSLDVANAGHNALLVYHRDENSVTSIKTRGRPLGMIDPEEFNRTLESATVQLEAGDSVLIYTDGITESMNGRKELYGEKRLLEVFKTFAELAPGELVKKIAESAHAFAGDARQFDDMTLVALRLEEPNAPKGRTVNLAEEVNQTVDRYLSEKGG